MGACAGKSIDRVRAQLQVRVRASVQAELESGKVGNFYALRIGVIVGLYEAFQLYNKAQAMPDGNKQKAEFAAAALATTAVALDLMHTGAEWTSKKYGAGTATGRIAANWGGGVRFYGVFLGAVAGAIGGVLDIGSSIEQDQKNRSYLSVAYLIRAMASFAVTALIAGIAVSGSGPYLRMLMNRTGNPIILSILKVLDFFARRLAAEHVLRLMRASLARLAWAGLAISSIVWLLQPKIVEVWCEKSVFRMNKKTKGFKGQGEELVMLGDAFNKMVSV